MNALSLIDQNAKFKPDALRAVYAFAKSKPWRGTVAERKEKFQQLHRALVAAYGMPATALVFLDVEADTHSLGSFYAPDLRAIVIRGKMSVITYLHEFAHARGMLGEVEAVRWSLNLFRRCFKISFGRLVFDGLLAFSPSSPYAPREAVQRAEQVNQIMAALEFPSMN